MGRIHKNRFKDVDCEYLSVRVKGHETRPGHACCEARRRGRLHWGNCHWARERVSASVWVYDSSVLMQYYFIPFHHHLLLCLVITAYLLPPWISPPCILPSWWLTICATPPCCRKAHQRDRSEQTFYELVFFFSNIRVFMPLYFKPALFFILT